MLPHESGAEGRGRGLLYGLPLVLLAVLVSGCVTPGRAPAAAVSAEDGSVQATSWSAAVAAASSEEGAGCAPDLLLEDERQVVAAGRGGKEFVLDAPCQLEATLTLRAAAGSLDIQLEGPEGPVFQREFDGFATDVARVFIQDGNAGSGRYPAGVYRYTFTATGAVEFRFEVHAAP